MRCIFILLEVTENNTEMKRHSFEVIYCLMSRQMLVANGQSSQNSRYLLSFFDFYIKYASFVKMFQ